MNKTSNKYCVLLIYLALALATLAVYWQMHHNDFVNFDDNSYVTENEHVKAGFTRDSIVWAIGFTETSYWHPLTLFSHMLDCQLYGLKAGMHHLSSLIVHIANALLLFAVLKRMTGALYSSAFAAALFALHPLNVDSVAWVAERKSVLSTFFWLLTMAGYLRYVKRPGKGRYLLMILTFVLGLMAKPMLVTLPFVLLLLDYWPLGRLQLGRAANRRGRKSQWKPFYLLVLEKVPLFVLSVVSIWLSSISLRRFIGCSVPIKLRIANALVCYVRYIEKMLWPRDLAVLYPYPNTLPAWQAIAAGLLLLAISILVIRSARNHKYLPVGWLWYLGTLVPVSGLMQRGLWPAMADRWAYVPLIGLFIIIAWGLSDILARWRYRKVILGASALVALLALSICTGLQVRHWRSSITLFEHTVEVTGDNCVAHFCIGISLRKQGKLDEAIKHYTEALRINPNYPEAQNNLGCVLFEQGRVDQAVTYFTEVLRINPGYAKAHHNLGNALSQQDKLDEAIAHFTEALRIKPDFAEASHDLGCVLFQQGKIDEAIKHYTQALRIDSNFAEAQNNLGNALLQQGKLEQAITYFTEALRIKPDYAEAHHNLGNALFQQGKINQAITYFIEALQIEPDYAEAHHNLGNALFQQGKHDEAITHFTEALLIKPDFAEAHNDLAVALANKGRLDEAITHVKEALRINPDFVKARSNLSVMLARQKKLDR